MQKSQGQKTTLVVHDPCPGYVPPAQREREAARETRQLHLQQQQYNENDINDDGNDDAGMELELDDQEEEQQAQPLKQYDNFQIPPQKQQSNDFPTVVLDCANIGWAFGMETFSPAGLSIAFQFFRDFHVNVVGFLPASYYTRRPTDGSRGNPMKQVSGIALHCMTTNKLAVMQDLEQRLASCA